VKKKTNKAAAKRFRLTGKGKVRRRKAYKSHILTKKSPKRKRHLRKAAIASHADTRRLKTLLST
jgi:large subunit ribosomal protein L35